MGKQLIALAASDIHFNDWKQFNENDERLQVTINILADLFIRSEDEDVPILMPGDFNHTPKGLSTKTIVKLMDFMSEIRDNVPGGKMCGITGNHDGSYYNSLWGSLCKAFPKNLYNLDFDECIIGNNIRVFGLPYRRRNIDLVKQIKELTSLEGKKILLLHTELYGALDPSGYEANPQNFSRESLALFKDFDLVLSGHIHKHTQIKDNVYMVGAINQQRKSDSGCEMGYLEIYDDFSVEFISTKAPKFRYYNEGENHEDTDDFWIEIPKPKKIKKESEAEFKSNMDKTKMAKLYSKETGIKNQKKIKTLIGILNQTEE